MLGKETNGFKNNVLTRNERGIKSSTDSRLKRVEISTSSLTREKKD